MDVREKLVKLLAEKCMATCKERGLNVCSAEHCNKHKEECTGYYADHLIAHGVTVQGATDNNVGCKWISVKDRLPEDGEAILIWSGGCHVATIEKGITEEERRKMKSGELPDPEETGWTLSTGHFTTKRSRTYTRADVFGNNKVPYCWNSVNSSMNWFGQDVTHWMPLPDAPKGE